jgi:hypothetical protein
VTRDEQRKMYNDFARKFRADHQNYVASSTTLLTAWYRHYGELVRTQMIQDLVLVCTF